MMTKAALLHREWRFALMFLVASVAGFCADALLLHLALDIGLSPALSRAVSLVCAIQITFALSVLLLRSHIDRSTLPRQWLPYMAAQGLGNLFNYGVFLALVSSHLPIASGRLFALVAGCVMGWSVNYLGARVVLFSRQRKAEASA